MTTQEELREAVARIIDPEALFDVAFVHAMRRGPRDKALAKADDILAIVSKFPEVGELVKAATDLLAIRASIIGGFRVDVQEEASRRLDRLASALATTSGKEP